MFSMILDGFENTALHLSLSTFLGQEPFLFSQALAELAELLAKGDTSEALRHTCELAMAGAGLMD